MTAATEEKTAEEKTAEEVTFKRSDLVKMFTEYGWAAADKWSDKSLREKLKKNLAKVVKSHREQELPESEEGRGLMELVVSALEAGKKIIFDPLVKEGEKGEEIVKPKKKDKKPAAKSTTVSKNGHTPKKPKAERNGQSVARRGDTPQKSEPKKGTMIGTVIELLRKASEKKPVKKDKIKEKLVSMFPDHSEKSIGDSINWYINTLERKHGIPVSKNENGFWVK